MSPMAAFAMPPISACASPLSHQIILAANCKISGKNIGNDSGNAGNRHNIGSSLIFSQFKALHQERRSQRQEFRQDRQRFRQHLRQEYRQHWPQAHVSPRASSPAYWGSPQAGMEIPGKISGKISGKTGKTAHPLPWSANPDHTCFPQSATSTKTRLRQKGKISGKTGKPHNTARFARVKNEKIRSFDAHRTGPQHVFQQKAAKRRVGGHRRIAPRRALWYTQSV